VREGRARAWVRRLHIRAAATWSLLAIGVVAPLAHSDASGPMHFLLEGVSLGTMMIGAEGARARSVGGRKLIMKNRELFERIAARTLATAFEECPVPVDFHAKDILDAERIDRTAENYKVADSTLDWLHAQGFLSAAKKRRITDKEAKHNYREYRKSVLTAAGFVALGQNVNLTVKTGNQRAGDFLLAQLKTSGGEAHKAVVSEAMKDIIGAVAALYIGGSVCAEPSCRADSSRVSTLAP
jgi:hypothetical protein